MSVRLLAPVLLASVASSARAASVSPSDDDGPRDIQVGHWVEVRGALDDGTFVAEKVTVGEEQEYEMLLGTIAAGDVRADGFTLLGQPVEFSDKTDWLKVDAKGLADACVKVEGYWRGPRKFSSRSIALRNANRDRIAGRVDQVEYTDTGVRLRVMRYVVEVSDDVQFEALRPLAELQLSEPRTSETVRSATIDEDDLFGRGFALTDTLRVTGHLESKLTLEDEFDLDDADPADRRDLEGVARVRATWTPRSDLYAVVELRHRQLWRDDDEDGSSTDGTTRLGETFVEWSELFGGDWQLRVGRQDFDDEREWIYDQNLDGVRAFGVLGGVHAELSLSTTLSDGSPIDEEAVNAIAYLSNGDEDEHVAAWVMHRDFDFGPESRRTLVGVRALGEYVDGFESWLDVAAMTGERGGRDVVGWGYDVGTTWRHDAVDPFAFSIGYALGSGGDPNSSTDRTFRQTGLNDNNAKLGGVTSFRYYGELFSPELANMGVLTLGTSIEVAEKTSLDLVYHSYRQDFVTASLVDVGIDVDPDGIHADLGSELDLILGCRRWRDWDLEVVTGWFHPGSAFPDADDAMLFEFQVRRRF